MDDDGGACEAVVGMSGDDAELPKGERSGHYLSSSLSRARSDPRFDSSVDSSVEALVDLLTYSSVGSLALVGF